MPVVRCADAIMGVALGWEMYNRMHSALTLELGMAQFVPTPLAGHLELPSVYDCHSNTLDALRAVRIMHMMFGKR